MLTARIGKEKKYINTGETSPKIVLGLQRKFLQYEVKYVLQIELKDRLCKKKQKTKKTPKLTEVDKNICYLFWNRGDERSTFRIKVQSEQRGRFRAQSQKHET